MTHALTRTAVSLAWPTLVPLAAAVAWLHWRPAPGVAWLGWLPHVTLAAAALLAWRFNRTRIVFAALLLGLAIELLAPQTPLPNAIGAAAPETLLPLLAAAVPLALTAMVLLPEKGLLTVTGLLRWGLVGAVAWAARDPAGLEPWTTRALVARELPEWLALPQPAAAAFALAALVLLARFARDRGPATSGLLGALAAFALALHTAPGSPAWDVYLGTAGLILLLAVVESSYSLAYRDELTGLPARRALNETLRSLGGRYTVAMVDVDHFKKFNDKYGHDAGDECLRMVAAKLARVRGGGKAFRYGGEEFTVVFPGKDIDAAAPHLETLRRAIADGRFTVRSVTRPKKKPKTPRKKRTRRQVKVTVSLGAAVRERGEGSEAVLKRADKRLYAAKKAGRNRLEV